MWKSENPRYAVFNTIVAHKCVALYAGPMRDYLSSTQVADELGISRDALNSEIRAGGFVSPDVVVGGRFQGWSRETVEQVRQDREGGNVIRCDIAGVRYLITEVREAAETVRAYGFSPDKAVSDVYVQIPRTLLILVARMESEMRRLIVWDHTCARSIAGSDDPRHHEETPVEFAMDPVHSLVSPLGTDPQMRSYRLRNAAAQLGAVVTRMPDALKSAEARAVMRALGAERDKITDYADELEQALNSSIA